MQQESPKEAIEKLLAEADEFIKLSTARLLAENEPIGDLVVLSQMDDSLVYSDLWAHLKIMSDWLKMTEDLYKAQFSEGFPRKDGRYDLTEKPTSFKSRLDIFKEQVEAWESSGLWKAKVIFNDPLYIVKRMRRDTESQGS